MEPKIHLKYIRNRFIAGLLILLPTVVTAWIIWKIFSSVDSLLEPVQQRFPIVDHPGVGFVAVLLIRSGFRHFSCPFQQ